MNDSPSLRSWFALVAVVCACGEGPSSGQSSSGSASASAPPPSASVASAPVRPTATDAAIAMHNLSAQIDDARRVSARRPNDLAVRVALFDLLRQRASVLDSVDDLLDAAKLAEGAPDDFPEEKAAYVLKVRGLAALHRFRDARAYLQSQVLCAPGEGNATKAAASASPATAPPRPSARERSPSPPTGKPGPCPRWKGKLEPGEGERLLASIDLATGRLDAAEAVLRAQADAVASSDNLHLHAVVLGAMGRVDQASSRFDQALAAYRNVSPFPLAEIHGDRAMMWQRVGEMDRATQDFEIANLLLPSHVHVATHLAGLRAPRAAVLLLAPLASDTRSADLLAALGTFEDMSKDGAGDAHLDEARRRFAELEQVAPEAYADHAAWFWLGAGKDPARALRLSRVNLAERQTSEAFELALRAATDAGDRAYACEVAADAQRFAYPSDLLVLYLRQLGDCTAPPATASASTGPRPPAPPAP